MFKEQEGNYWRELPNATRNGRGSEKCLPTHTSISDIKPSFVPHWLKLQEVHLPDSKLWSQIGGTCRHVHSHCNGSPQQGLPKQSEVAGAGERGSWIVIYALKTVLVCGVQEHFANGKTF